MPVTFTAAVNRNRVFYDYIQTGNYTPRASVPTHSNAMDVGAPSNLERLISLYPNHAELTAFLSAYHYRDEETLDGMKRFYQRYHCIIDPHTAVGYLAAEQAMEKNIACHYVLLSTAHPAKFPDVVRAALGSEIESPERLANMLTREKRSRETAADYPAFKRALLPVLGD
jgi:threonine synthase